MINVDLNLHTMIVLVGPSGCGKSYFSNVLKKELENKLKENNIDPNIQYLSSDNLRREVLGNNELHKHDPIMMSASKSAFSLLHHKIDLAMSHPTLAHYIIVDTTGLSKEFRSQLIKQAKGSSYNTACVIFDYNKNDEYFKHCDNDPNFQGWVARKHLERMRKYFWKEFNRKDFHKTIKVKSKDFSELEVTIPNIDNYTKCILSEDPIYDIVGDLHGCINEFKALLSKLGYQLENNKILKNVKDENRKIILVGDIIDKGYASKETLQFVLDNLDFIIPIKGNHENFVTKWHQGLLKNIDMEEDFRKKCFDMTFDDDQNFIDNLNKLDEVSIPFAKTKNFIVTHGPAENSCLEKLTTFGIRNQMKGKQGREQLWDLGIEENREFYAYIKEEAERSYPYHVFGHIPQKKEFKIGNKICVDTGCTQGGRLTAVTIMGNKTYFNSVPMKSEIIHKEELQDLFPKKKFDFNLDDLSSRERSRLRFSIQDKIGFISGTMSPSAADVEAGEIEPIETALQYYKDNDVEEVVIQPKYMGSRCNMYVDRNIDKCFATTRRGYRIKKVDLTEEFKKMQEKIFKLYPDAQTVVLDGELMPWHVLGEDLIERDFKVVEKGIESELSLLESTGFEKHLSDLIARPDFNEYLVDEVKGTKKELADKYGQHNVNTFKNFKQYNHVGLEKHRKGLNTYKRQIEVFGAPGDTHYNPFAVLKVVNKDGTELLEDDNEKMFRNLRGEFFLKLNLNNLEDSLNRANVFMNAIKEKEMEGIVVKPRFYKEGVAPFMKVRTKEYLTIVYGYDFQFPEKYERLLKSKRTRNKLRTSVNEYEIGRKLLQTKVGDITEDNIEYKKLIANMIAEEKKEESFDPRL